MPDDTVGTEIERMDTRVEEHSSFYYQGFAVWFDIRVLPIASGLALLYRDITARKQEEQARIAAQRRLEQVLEVPGPAGA